MRYGNWQKRLRKQLLAGDAIPADAARIVGGQAKNYLSKYQRSLDSLVGKMELEGVKVNYTPGPRGGKWGGQLRMEGRSNMRTEQTTQAALAAEAPLGKKGW